MKPTQQEIIDLAHEASGHIYPEWLYGVPIFALERLVHLALERFGAGGGEPVAWMDEFGNVFPLGAQRGPKHLNEPMKPLYAAPQPAKRVHLTDEEITEGCRSMGVGAYQTLAAAFKAGARFAETKQASPEKKQ